MMKAQFVPPKIIRRFYSEAIWESSIDKILVTIDDSPSENGLPKILNELEKNGIKALFFVEGRRIKGRENLIKEIISSGHFIGNHSMNHLRMKKMKPDEIGKELRTVNEMLSGITGTSVRFFRPPFGNFNRNLIRSAARQNLKTMLWSLFPYDYKNSPAIVKFAIRKYLINNCIAVFHDKDDCADTSVEGIEYLTKAAREKCFEIGNPTECLRTYF